MKDSANGDGATPLSDNEPTANAVLPVGILSSVDGVELVGLDQILAALRRLTATACARADSLLPKVLPRQALDESVFHDLRMVNRGVQLRSLFPRQAQRHEATLQYAMHVGAHGVQVHAGEVSPVRMVIYDRSVAVVSAVTTDSNATPTAVVTRSEGVVTLLSAHFDLLWGQSVPLAATGCALDGLTARDEAILAAVIAGRSDRSIAREHGITERTVQRTIRSLRELFGVESRTALAAEGTRRGTECSA